MSSCSYLLSRHTWQYTFQSNFDQVMWVKSLYFSIIDLMEIRKLISFTTKLIKSFQFINWNSSERATNLHNFDDTGVSKTDMCHPAENSHPHTVEIWCFAMTEKVTITLLYMLQSASNFTCLKSQTCQPGLKTFTCLWKMPLDCAAHDVRKGAKAHSTLLAALITSDLPQSL